VAVGSNRECVSTWTGTLNSDGVIRGHMSGSFMPVLTAPFTAQRQ